MTGPGARGAAGGGGGDGGRAGGVVTVGVDLGGTKCLGVALAGGSVAAEVQVPTPRGETALLSTMAEVVRDLSAEAGGPVSALGVGVPGFVDKDGVLRFAPNLPGVAGLPVRAELEGRLGLPVQVDNDATCAAWGEQQLGAARGYDDVVVVTLGTGIGGGVVCDGQVYRGANGFAGEVGHMVVDPHGPPCPCGQKGCWERFASGSGLGRLAREAALAGRGTRVVELAGGDPETVRGEHLTRALAEGDDEAAAVMAEFAWWLALGLVNLINIFDPGAVVLGGGVVAAGEALLEPARRAVRELVAGGGARPEVPLLPAALGARAGAIGAASLAAVLCGAAGGAAGVGAGPPGGPPGPSRSSGPPGPASPSGSSGTSGG